MIQYILKMDMGVVIAVTVSVVATQHYLIMSSVINLDLGALLSVLQRASRLAQCKGNALYHH